jgi:hypothetical protein
VTIAYTPKDAVIDIVAVLLILAPEPVTTPIGISLLLRKRGTAAQQHEPVHPLRLYPEYQYRVENIRGREITWEVRTIMPGQLPLGELNKPAVKIKPREQYIYSRTPAAATPARKLPPGVKVHHEIYRPNPIPLAGRNVYVPGETIHHTLREMPQSGPMVNRGKPAANIHHTIENSPGYIKAQCAGDTVSRPNIIHHTIQGSPGVQHGNPANIVKPVRIVEHHELNTTPSINVNGRIIQPPKPAARKPYGGGKNNNPGNGR